jgi:myosin-crossreactive antigen
MVDGALEQDFRKFSARFSEIMLDCNDIQASRVYDYNLQPSMYQSLATFCHCHDVAFSRNEVESEQSSKATATGHLFT